MDRENKAEYKIKGISQGISPNNIFMVLLYEKQSKSLFPLPIPEQQEKILVEVMRQSSTEKIPLIDSYRQIVMATGSIMEGICISHVDNGVFMADVYLNNNGIESSCSINAGDALIIATANRLPVFIDNTLQKDVIVNNEEHSFSFSIKTLSIEFLQKALNDAISREQYEVASVLRDEINKRK